MVSKVINIKLNFLHDLISPIESSLKKIIQIGERRAWREEIATLRS